MRHRHLTPDWSELKGDLGDVAKVTCSRSARTLDRLVIDNKEEIYVATFACRDLSLFSPKGSPQATIDHP